MFDKDKLVAVPIGFRTFRIDRPVGAETETLECDWVNLQEMSLAFRDNAINRGIEHLIPLSADKLVTRFHLLAPSASKYHDSSKYELEVVDILHGKKQAVDIYALHNDLYWGRTNPFDIFVPKVWADLAFEYFRAGWLSFRCTPHRFEYDKASKLQRGAPAPKAEMDIVVSCTHVPKTRLYYVVTASQLPNF